MKANTAPSAVSAPTPAILVRAVDTKPSPSLKALRVIGRKVAVKTDFPGAEDQSVRLSFLANVGVQLKNRRDQVLSSDLFNILRYAEAQQITEIIQKV